MIADAVLYGLAPNPGSSVHVVRTLAGILASSCLYHLPIALGQQWLVVTDLFGMEVTAAGTAPVFHRIPLHRGQKSRTISNSAGKGMYIFW